MREKLLRAAIVGVGAWGRNVARELAGAGALAGFVSRKTTEDELRAALGFHVPRLTLDEVLRDPAITVVAIATPIPLLAGFARAALEAGKHVFVEKPLAETAAEAQTVAGIAAARGLVLMTGYVFLHHPVIGELKRRLEPARVRNVMLRWDKFGSFAEPIEQTLLTHHLALALHLLGEPRGGTIRRGAGVRSACDSVEARLDYGAFEAVSRIDRTVAQRRHDVTVEMTDGSRLIWDDASLYRGEGEGGRELIYRSEETSLGAEIAAFVAAASGEGRALPGGGDFAARVLTLCERLGG